MKRAMMFFVNLFMLKVHLIRTRPYEMFCAAAYLSWAVTLFLDQRLFGLPTFQGFEWPAHVYASAYLGMFALSLIGLRQTSRLRFVAGYVMIVGALAWFLTAVEFWEAYPPLNPAMSLYAILAYFNLIIGISIIEKSKRMGT